MKDHSMFWLRMQRIPKSRGKRVFLLSFRDLSSPRLASGSLGPPTNFNVKKPARLSELVTSWLRHKLAWASCRSTKCHFFAINRLEGVEEGGGEHSVVKKIERIRREEKETKSRWYRILAIVINLYIVPRSVFFVLPSVSFVFEDWMWSMYP